MNTVSHQQGHVSQKVKWQRGWHRAVGWLWERSSGGIWAIALAAWGLYMFTLAPSVATIFDDSLEFHVVIPLLGIPHPPGYPLYTLVGKGWVELLPLRDPAWRLNAFSALAASLALGLLGQATLRVVPHGWAVAAALAVFAVSPTFWGQATIAEVYALHALLLAGTLWGLLSWLTTSSDRAGRYALYGLVAFFGLGLAHHRLILLLAPSIVVGLVTRRHLWPRERGFWQRWGALLLAPLLLYAYIPLVGARVGSLDGTYVNTWQGFWDWILARAYRVFLTENPFNVQRTFMDYVRLYVEEMGLPALIFALLGIGGRFRQVPRVWSVLALAWGLYWGFAVVYKVVDIEVFFLSAVLVSVPFVAAGLVVGHEVLAQGVARRWGKKRPGRGWTWVWAFISVMILVVPVARARVAAWENLNRADDWAVYDYGWDIVQQPLPPGSTIVGILGETTLVRYFRDVLGYRPDISVIPADREEARHAAIQQLLAAGRPVFITRPLAGAPERYSLDAVGPLVRVWPKGQDDRPMPTVQVNVPFTEAVSLAGYDVRWRSTRRSAILRVVLYWDVMAVPEDAYKISARLVRTDGSVVVAVDNVPVHNTYPTLFWTPGERVVDVYDLSPEASSAASVLIILYRAADGSEVHRFTFPVPPLRAIPPSNYLTD